MVRHVPYKLKNIFTYTMWHSGVCFNECFRTVSGLSALR